MSRRLVVIFAALALSLIGAASAVAAGASDYSAIEGQFICVSCHEPLPMVHSPQAISEKQTLQGLVKQGPDSL